MRRVEGVQGHLTSRLPKPAPPAAAPAAAADGYSFREHYTKYEHMIAMRDGVRLLTVVYVPKEPKGDCPMLMTRTPYGVGPYGHDVYPGGSGPMANYAEEGFVFVNQDVRGRNGSEGEFVHMRPHLDVKAGDDGVRALSTSVTAEVPAVVAAPAAASSSTVDIDESSDTFDTIEWLVNNVPGNNGRVGIMGISYPGFYSAAGMIDNHPALKAASPQAPINDFFIGDDFHHNGAFYLPHAFNFFKNFGKANANPTRPAKPFGEFDYGTADGYEFYLGVGPLKNLGALMEQNGPMQEAASNLWPMLVEHDNYDEVWQASDIRRHLNDVSCAVLSVGGWYDAEDPLGPLSTFYETRRRNPENKEVTLVMGPWAHGQWSGGEGITTMGNVCFFTRTEEYYRKHIELPFLQRHLLPPGLETPPEAPPAAIVFEVGTNVWKKYASWPPAEAKSRALYFHPGGVLSFDEAPPPGGHDEYISDPAKPVPYIPNIAISMTRAHMTDDQRFASSRPDVLVYQTAVLEADVTLLGPFKACLSVSTTGTDSDFVVKLIDVYSGDYPNPDPEHNYATGSPAGLQMGGYQQLVRGDYNTTSRDL